MTADAEHPIRNNYSGQGLIVKLKWLGQCETHIFPDHSAKGAAL